MEGVKGQLLPRTSNDSGPQLNRIWLRGWRGGGGVGGGRIKLELTQLHAV